MKKTKLLALPTYDFELLGFIAPIKDYKMAWAINHALGINLTKSKDFNLEFLDHSTLVISQYILQKEHGFIQLLKNKSFSDGPNALHLIPELKMVDYFLLVQDFTMEMNINSYIERLSRVPFIQNVVKIDINKLKSKENLLTY
jgi:hypothetical protein